MRHLRSVLYALVLAPAAWILCGVGFDRDLTGRARDDGGIESLTGVLLLLLAGAAYALLLFSPISPLGPLLAGLAFAGVGAWARLAPESYAGVWPATIAKGGFDVSTPGYGLAVLLAVPLLATALSARRWRAFEPPEILLIGTVGRARGAARVAGTPIASERTTVIPQQRHSPEFVPGFGASSADTTQVVMPGHPADDQTIAMRSGRQPSAFNDARAPFDEDDEKTTLLQLGRPAPVFPAPAGPAGPAPAGPASAGSGPAGSAPAGSAPAGPAPAGRASDSDDRRTEDIAAPSWPAWGADAPTRDVTAPDLAEITRNVTADDTAQQVTTSAATPHTTADETTRNVTADDTAQQVTTSAATPHTTPDETTRDVVAGETSRGGTAEVVAEDETTRLVLPAGVNSPAVDAATSADAAAGSSVSEDGDDRTQLLTLPRADGRSTGTTDHGEQTQLIRPGTVEPPGDRTQLLTFPAPGEATPVPVGEAEQSPENTKAMSIVAAERPDPGEDPTTRLTPLAEQPGEATTRPNPERRAATVSSIERPADETADDTRPLALPAPRPPAEDETTRLL